MGEANARAIQTEPGPSSSSSLTGIPGLLPLTLSVRKLRRRRLTTLEQRRAFKKLKQMVAHDNELAAAERAESRAKQGGAAAGRTEAELEELTWYTCTERFPPNIARSRPPLRGGNAHGEWMPPVATTRACRLKKMHTHTHTYTLARRLIL